MLFQTYLGKIHLDSNIILDSVVSDPNDFGDSLGLTVGAEGTCWGWFSVQAHRLCCFDS